MNIKQNIKYSILVSAQTRGKPLCFAALALLALTLGAQAQYLTNGSFESWGTLSGTPAAGTPTGWTNSGTLSPIQGIGLVAGSNYSSIIQAGNFVAGSSGISENVSSGPANFNLSFEFASAPVTGGNRTLQLYVYETGVTGGNSVLNLRLITGSTTSLLSLQAYSITAGNWVTLSTDAFSASTFNGSGGFTTLNAYTVSITGSFTGAATSSYSITYGAVGGSTTTLSGLTAFFATPGTGGVSQVAFNGVSSSANYAVDDVVLTAIAVPEPSTWALLLGGFGCLFLLHRQGSRRFAGRA